MCLPLILILGQFKYNIKILYINGTKLVLLNVYFGWLSLYPLMRRTDDDGDNTVCSSTRSS